MGRVRVPKLMNFRKGSKRPPPAPQNGPYLWKSCACISYYLALVPPCIYSTISIIKKLQHNFPKMRGGGSKAVWNFSENSSDLVEPSFPYFRLISRATNWEAFTWSQIRQEKCESTEQTLNGSTNLGDLFLTQQPNNKTKTARISMFPRWCVPNNVSRYLPDRFFLAPSLSFWDLQETILFIMSLF